MEEEKNEAIRGDTSVDLSQYFWVAISGSAQNSVQDLVSGHCPT